MTRGRRAAGHVTAGQATAGPRSPARARLSGGTVRPCRPLPARWLRAMAALTGLALLAAGALLLPPSSRSAAAVGRAGSLGARSSVTVHGPHLWDPARQRPLPAASTVTVSQTSSLVNQEVHVSWRDFTPSSTVLYDATATNYPVMVAECRGIRPRSLDQCYGANNGGVQGAFGPFGPMNTAYATSAPNGTGQLDIQILTAAENQFLGCDQRHRCSLVVVPAQGGNVFASHPDCSDHSADIGGAAIGAVAFSTSSGSCSWDDRIVIPLRFSPTPTGCPLRNANFTVIGSPMLARAMDEWRAGLCAGTQPLSIQYNSAIAEPLAVTDAVHGLGDVALTTRPAKADGTPSPGSGISSTRPSPSRRPRSRT